jgi:hypothetical protein
MQDRLSIIVQTVSYSSSCPRSSTCSNLFNAACEGNDKSDIMQSTDAAVPASLVQHPCGPASLDDKVIIEQRDNLVSKCLRAHYSRISHEFFKFRQTNTPSLRKGPTIASGFNDNRSTSKKSDGLEDYKPKHSNKA